MGKCLYLPLSYILEFSTLFVVMTVFGMVFVTFFVTVFEMDLVTVLLTDLVTVLVMVLVKLYNCFGDGFCDSFCDGFFFKTVLTLSTSSEDQSNFFSGYSRVRNKRRGTFINFWDKPSLCFIVVCHLLQSMI